MRIKFSALSMPQEILVIDGILATFRPEVKSPGPIKALDSLQELSKSVMTLGKATRVYMMEIFFAKGLKGLKSAGSDAREIEKGKKAIQTELTYLSSRNPLHVEPADIYPCLLKMAEEAVKPADDIS